MYAAADRAETEPLPEIRREESSMNDLFELLAVNVGVDLEPERQMIGELEGEFFLRQAAGE